MLKQCRTHKTTLETKNYKFYMIFCEFKILDYNFFKRFCCNYQYYCNKYISLLAYNWGQCYKRMTDSNKHPTLQQYGINYGCKSFMVVVPCVNSIQLISFSRMLPKSKLMRLYMQANFSKSNILWVKLSKPMLE
jgi:hypothetical protein